MCKLLHIISSIILNKVTASINSVLFIIISLYNLKVILKDEENSKNKLELIQKTEFELKNLSEVLNEIK